MIRVAFLLPASMLLVSCASRSEATSAGGDPLGVGAPSPSLAPSASAGATPSARPPEPEEEGELRPGRRTFRGMVRATKDGYEVRGVILEGQSLPAALARRANDGIPSDPQWFLGAVVRVTAELFAHDEAPPRPDGLAEQGRQGSWLGATSVELAELVTRAEVVEGELVRSKGFFQIGAYLVNRQDLGWSLSGSGGGRVGDRVRLWGQPSVVQCAPNAQCLVGGSLPIFAVGRAEKLR